MQLHQLLRTIAVNVPIIILDIEGIEICRIKSKTEVPLDLYEYSVMLISLGIPKNSKCKTYLAILIDK